jgi:sugar phosphate isomerase/epimerase
VGEIAKAKFAKANFPLPPPPFTGSSTLPATMVVKLSANTLSWSGEFAAGTMDLFDMFEECYELRLDGVSPAQQHFESTEPEYLERLRQKATARGLHMDYIGVSTNHAQTGQERQANIDNMKKWIDVAVQIGIPMCRTFGGWMREGDDEEETFQRIVGSIKECVAYAEEKKILIGLHNHNHGQIPATGAMVVRLLNAVDSPYFVGLLDSGQWYGSPGIGEGTTAYGKPDGAHGTPRGELDPAYDYFESIRQAANSGKLVQVRAKIYRIRSGSEDWLDYDRIMPILKDVGYNGWMSIVYEGQDDLEEKPAMRKAAAFLRSMLAKHKH